MANWPQTPSWIPVANINEGNQYEAQDGVTFDDMNNIINNMIYLKKYNGMVDVMSVDAQVVNNVLVLKPKEV